MLADDENRIEHCTFGAAPLQPAQAAAAADDAAADAARSCACVCVCVFWLRARARARARVRAPATGRLTVRAGRSKRRARREELRAAIARAQFG